ncbi:Uncharacterised protein [Vibrio cholerae]|nr:Uncharacterised protein [Vibrio cholerae]CSC34760.1 Uncharacterised protein [Vibrio cholerae]CSC72318.1 Uncharacterised protein [Vibrio cholerae]CSC83933.1 Uncharacterised protein [Vibrio cholerae]CSI12068.1 Uncharacterised protein [Vibrio cholerae]
MPEIITGKLMPSSSNTLSTANAQALALSVSKMVSMRIRSLPPLIKARVDSE